MIFRANIQQLKKTKKIIFAMWEIFFKFSHLFFFEPDGGNLISNLGFFIVHRIRRFKYQSTTSGCTDIGIISLEFLAKSHYVYNFDI